MLLLLDPHIRLVLLNHLALRLSEAALDELDAFGIPIEKIERLWQLSITDLNRLACWRRSKSEPPRRPNFEPGVEADFERVGCG